jgi:hypothetical protein
MTMAALETTDDLTGYGSTSALEAARLSVGLVTEIVVPAFLLPAAQGESVASIGGGAALPGRWPPCQTVPFQEFPNVFIEE